MDDSTRLSVLWSSGWLLSPAACSASATSSCTSRPWAGAFSTRRESDRSAATTELETQGEPPPLLQGWGSQLAPRASLRGERAREEGHSYLFHTLNRVNAVQIMTTGIRQ